MKFAKCATDFMATSTTKLTLFHPNSFVSPGSVRFVSFRSSFIKNAHNLASLGSATSSSSSRVWKVLTTNTLSTSRCTLTCLRSFSSKKRRQMVIVAMAVNQKLPPGYTPFGSTSSGRSRRDTAGASLTPTSSFLGFALRRFTTQVLRKPSWAQVVVAVVAVVATSVQS